MIIGKEQEERERWNSANLNQQERKLLEKEGTKRKGRRNSRKTKEKSSQFFFLAEPAGNLSSHKALKIPRTLTRTRDPHQATVSCGIMVMFFSTIFLHPQSTSDFHSLTCGPSARTIVYTRCSQPARPCRSGSRSCRVRRAEAPVTGSAARLGAYPHGCVWPSSEATC